MDSGGVPDLPLELSVPRHFARELLGCRVDVSGQRKGMCSCAARKLNFQAPGGFFSWKD